MATARIFHLFFLFNRHVSKNKQRTTPTYAIKTNTKRHIARRTKRTKKCEQAKEISAHTQIAAQLGRFAATLWPIADTVRFKLCVLTVSSRDPSVCPLWCLSIDRRRRRCTKRLHNLLSNEFKLFCCCCRIPVRSNLFPVCVCLNCEHAHFQVWCLFIAFSFFSLELQPVIIVYSTLTFS